jgi:hypothetical protein
MQESATIAATSVTFFVITMLSLLLIDDMHAGSALTNSAGASA